MSTSKVQLAIDHLQAAAWKRPMTMANSPLPIIGLPDASLALSLNG